MNENSPIVAFDRRLGEHVDYIDVDYDELVDYMQERGFDNDVIKNTQININSRVVSRKNKRLNDTMYTYGTYAKKTDTIDIHTGSEVEVRRPMYDYYARHDDIDLGDIMKESMDKSLSSSVSRTLGHELEHKLVNYEGGMNSEKKYWAKKIGKAVMYSMGTYLVLNHCYHEAADFYNIDNSAILNSSSPFVIAGLSSTVPLLIDKYAPGAARKDSMNMLAHPKRGAAVKLKSQLLIS